MNRKKWICTAAAITGLLLAVIVGLSVRHMKNGSYVSASELAGQKRAEASKDQENVAETEKSEEMCIRDRPSKAKYSLVTDSA